MSKHTPTPTVLAALKRELNLAYDKGFSDRARLLDANTLAWDHERRNLQQTIENQKALIDRSASTRSKAEAWDKVIAALEEAAGESIVGWTQGMSLADAAVKYIKQLAKEAFNVDDQKAELRREHRRQLLNIRKLLVPFGLDLKLRDYDFHFDDIVLIHDTPVTIRATTPDPLDYESRVLKDKMVHINGIPVMVSGVARTHRENWKLIYPEEVQRMSHTEPEWHGIPINEPADTKPVSELDTVKMERDLSIAEFDALSRDLAKLGITVKVRDDGSYAGVDYDKLGSGA